MKRRIPLAVAVAAGAVAAASVVAPALSATAQPVPPSDVAAANAAGGAAALVASRPAIMKASPDDTFVPRTPMVSHGLHYQPYDRTYKGLPVAGGDVVVVTDDAGTVKGTSVAQDRPISLASAKPELTAGDALAVAKKTLKTVISVEGTHLVVYAPPGRAAVLAWESTLRGTGADGVARDTVDVDARTGEVLDTVHHVTDVTGTGKGWIDGSVSLDTTQSGSTFSLKDPTYANLSCQNSSGNATFTGPDNAWGSGVGTDRETGCVDALYAAQTQAKMLSSWLDRNGQNGSGGAWPLRVGLNDENAYYDGTQVQIGHNTANQWIGAIDVVGHELGHGIDDRTPGSVSGGGTQEFVADTFGAATEWYANNPNDPPDYTVGEEINLVGRGPIRYMYNPSVVGDSNCYSSSIPRAEVHAAAGPGNHWFYLVAQGTSGNGQPASPTCNNSTVTGLGIQKAITIMYNAMLLKTSSSSYLKYRTWTLTAAKNLYPGDCTAFNTVKAAWDAVSVPAQAADPTCTGGTTPPSSAPASPSPTASSSTPATGGCTATVSDNAWTGGFVSTITVSAGSSALTGWTVSLTLPSGSAVTNSWNASASGSTGTVRFSNVSFNGTVPAGGSIEFGFQGTGTPPASATCSAS